MLKEIASFIETQSGFTLGTTLWFGHRPLTAADRCILIAFNAGGPAYFEVPSRRDVAVQILTRAASYVQAYTDAMTVYDALHGQSGWTLSGITSGVSYEAQAIEAQALPQYIGPDEKGRHEFSTNYIFRVFKQ